MKHIVTLNSFLVAVLCSAFFATSVNSAPMFFDVGLESSYNDNLSRTPDADGSSIDGFSSNLSAAVSKGYVLGEDLMFMAKLGGSYHVQHIDEAANYLSADAVLAVNFNPFNSLSAPQFKFSVQGRQKQYLNDFDSEQIYRSKFSIKNQFTSRFSTAIGAVRQSTKDQWAPVNTQVLESSNTDLVEYFAGMDIRSDFGIIYSKLSKIDGDHIWTVPVSGGFTGVFGPDTETLGVELGLNYPVSENAAIDIQARHYSVRRMDAELYDQTSFSIAYLKRLSF